MMMNILDEANQITSDDGGSRRAAYGPALQDSERVAALMSAVLGHTVPPEKVPLLMICLKLSRQSRMPKRDNLVDIAGWARVLEEVVEEQGDVEEIRKHISESGQDPCTT